MPSILRINYSPVLSNTHLHYLIEQKLDLSVFYPRYNNEEMGRPAYDPAMLLKIVLLKERYKRLGLSKDLYHDGILITADTGYANEDNMQYLHENNINAYIPDNQFRSRAPKFADQKKNGVDTLFST